MSLSLVKTGMQKPTPASCCLTKGPAGRVWGCFAGARSSAAGPQERKGRRTGWPAADALCTSCVCPHRATASSLHPCSRKCLTTSSLRGEGEASPWSVCQSPWCKFSCRGGFEAADVSSGWEAGPGSPPLYSISAVQTHGCKWSQDDKHNVRR